MQSSTPVVSFDAGVVMNPFDAMTISTGPQAVDAAVASDAMESKRPRVRRERRRSKADAALVRSAPIPEGVSVERQFGFVRVLADDRYANVVIDDASVGPTPTSFIKVEVGTHLIVWKEPDTGQVRKTERIEIGKGERIKVRAR